MRLPFFSTDPLLRLLRAKKIASLPDLQRTLGSQIPVTVFRKLRSRPKTISHLGRDGVVPFWQNTFLSNGELAEFGF